MTNRKKPGVAFWATVVVVAVQVVGYPLSTGPAFWLQAQGVVPASVIKVVYTPMEWIVPFVPEAISAPYREYNTWCQRGFPEPVDPRED
jgi:hypothetical protein